MPRSLARADDGRFVTRRIAGETIIVPVSGTVANLDAVYTLNEVGSFVWQRLDGDRSAREMAVAVAREYDVAVEEAIRDVEELFGALEAAGLVRQADGAGQP
jgi:hypothetical protein